MMTKVMRMAEYILLVARDDILMHPTDSTVFIFRGKKCFTRGNTDSVL